jgi:beta-glucuronidase
MLNGSFLSSAFSLVLLVAAGFSGMIPAHAQTISLDGPGWTFKTVFDDSPLSVTIPHSWPADETYRHYIGLALYQRDFDAPKISDDQTIRLHFDAVYNFSKVWLNGRMIGTHSGGYTPFEFDITERLKSGRNHLLLEVDNTPTLQSIPSLATSNGSGSAHYPLNGSANGEGIVGWLPYGGIVRPVSLLITNRIYFRGMKVEAHPNLSTGNASLLLRVTLHDAEKRPRSIELRGTVAGLTLTRHVNFSPGDDASVEWTATLHHAHLWSVRDPFLYEATLSVPGDILKARIGVRDIRVQGTKLLLNGREVHLFGANRVSEDPIEGLRESDAIVQRDMSDMLADNMRMMRIAHYPQTPALLDFADTHGILLIAEAGNWNMSGWQMTDPTVRATWKAQMKEMMEQDWNHPSIIAWSVGNEFESFTTEGIHWTRDMRAYTLSLDASRLITFASRFTSDPAVKTGNDEASRYSDFVCVNLYSRYADHLDHVHSLYPMKPIFVTEFGKMGEPGQQDPQRIADISTAVAAMKARPWVIGGSLWTWADYRSLHRGTGPSGVRYWGVVNLNREHRESWDVVQKLFHSDLP